LSFPTGDLPDNAVITTVSLRLKKQGLAGGVNPFGALKGLRGDSVYGYFGTSSALEAADFEAAAGHSFKIMVPKLKAGWYTLNLAGAKPDINVLTDYGG